MNEKLKNLIEFLNSKGLSQSDYEPYLNEIAKQLKDKKYGLIWEDKEETVFNEIINRLPLLVDVQDKTIISESNLPYNLIIEGDNLHTLKSLLYTHNEKIDVIYIDPPYNTGNKDFIYNDKYVDRDNTWRHSEWLSFMSKRLRLAKDLLSDDGVIFISIDDNELYQLKLLCDDIFGENQFVENFIWTKTATPPSLANKVRQDVEYILCYQKKKNNSRFFGRASENSDAPLANGSNKNTIITIPKNSCIFTNKKNGTISSGKKKSLLLLDDITVVDNKNANDFKIEFKSKWTQSNVDYEVSEGTFFLVKNENTFSIRYKKNTTSFIAPNKFLDKNKFPIETNEFGKKQLENILGESSFDYPKNTPLIKFLINMATYNKPNALVLDFFAGSGTTGHAVLELNKDDELNNIKSNRRFILCTNNENNICESITYERLKRVINGYTDKKGEFVEGLKSNLKYYKIQLHKKHDDYDDTISSLLNKCTDLISVKEDCYNVEKYDTYDILKSDTKAILIYKYAIPLDTDVKNISNILKEYDSAEKILYSTYTDNLKIPGITLKEFPIEIIEKIKTRGDK